MYDASSHHGRHTVPRVTYFWKRYPDPASSTTGISTATQGRRRVNPTIPA